MSNSVSDFIKMEKRLKLVRNLKCRFLRTKLEKYYIRQLELSRLRLIAQVKGIL